MSDLRPVSPGQPLEISAGDYNAMLDTARAFKRRTLNQQTEIGLPLAAGVVMVKNSSGGNRDVLEILAINAPLILPTDSLDRWRSAVTFDGVAPGATHSGRYVVLQEPIAAGAVGRAMVIGVTPVILNVIADSDRFAEVDSGTYATLKTGTTGSARILWKESGTGTKRGVVMLTGETPAVPPKLAAADPTANDDSAHGYQVGTIWINTTSKHYFVATDVTVGAAVWAAQSSVYLRTTDPTLTDDSGDGYERGSMWINTSFNRIFFAISVTPGAAVWSGNGAACSIFGRASNSVGPQADIVAADDGTMLQRRAGSLEFSNAPVLVRSGTSFNVCSVNTFTTSTTPPTAAAVKGDIHFIY